LVGLFNSIQTPIIPEIHVLYKKLTFNRKVQK
jgi:hypothetical protein